jgi:hypothetical protein
MLNFVQSFVEFKASLADGIAQRQNSGVVKEKLLSTILKNGFHCLTCIFDLREVQHHLFHHKVNLKGGNLFPQNKEVFDHEELAVSVVILRIDQKER